MKSLPELSLKAFHRVNIQPMIFDAWNFTFRTGNTEKSLCESSHEAATFIKFCYCAADAKRFHKSTASNFYELLRAYAWEA